MEAGMMPQAVTFVQWKIDTTYQYIHSCVSHAVNSTELYKYGEKVMVKRY
jgi:hypothetical protein